jgi:hypothetical protein
MMKRRAPILDRDALTAEIAGLSKASITNLRERWKAMHGKAPSREIGRSFLARAIAYRLQERTYGGLKSSTRRLLARVAEETATVSSPKKPQIRMARSGTILIREWQGSAHRVTMLDDGVSVSIGVANHAPRGGPQMSLDAELKVAKCREKRS